MNSDYEKQLETKIQQELQSLPEWPAPPTLVRRVMQRLEYRASMPWYRQPWQMWPAGLRVAALVLLMASFGGVCVASWELTRAAGFSVAWAEVRESFSGIQALWNTINVLLGAVVLVLKHLGTGFIVGCGLAIGMGYAICVGLGTACVRLAWARR
jgi:hypothetical protein